MTEYWKLSLQELRETVKLANPSLDCRWELGQLIKVENGKATPVQHDKSARTLAQVEWAFWYSQAK